MAQTTRPKIAKDGQFQECFTFFQKLDLSFLRLTSFPADNGALTGRMVAVGSS
jgi:hypothetical protein